MKNLLYLFFFVTPLACCTQPLTPEQWREDIRFFMAQAPKTHVNLYNSLTKSRFDSIGADLLQRVPQLSDAQIRAELVRWTAAIGDGHTHLTPPGLHVYRLQTFWFKEGLFVVNGDASTQKWIGWKLEKINNIPIEIVAEKVKPYQQRDGAQQIKAQAPVYLVTPEALEAVGVVKGLEKAIFTLKNIKTGELAEIELEPIVHRNVHGARHGGAEADADKAPLYRRHRDKFYWFEWLPDTKTLYFQYNVTRDDEREPVREFVQKLREAVDQNPVERFVVDLRWNGGGNLMTSAPFTNLIANHPKINQRGKLFVFLGRHTFSAASFFASTMEFRTKAIFIGEPTGASPNHYGDPRPVRLPNSGLEPQLSSIYWQNSFSWDKRPATQPDIVVDPTAADWFAGRDAALEVAIQYKALPGNKLSIPESLKEQLVGRYLLDGHQLTEVGEQQGRLHLSVAGFVDTELHLEQPGERLNADVRTLSVSPAGQNKIRLEAFGGSTVLEKLPAGFQLPKEMIAAGKIPEALAAYRAIKKANPTAQSVSENELNAVGYTLMNTHRMDAALAVFQLNTEFYPEGFNTWDSLAEYYMNAGDKIKAIEYYKKSIELNPNNENGKNILKKLE